jgi:signal transduction histidine kinase
VTACNNDGVWNLAGADVGLLLTPYFYQTAWFGLACLGAMGSLIWGIHVLRIRRIVARFELISQERARITRDLHDSLLQGFSGVVYQMEAAARLLQSNPQLSKQRLEHAIEQADQSLQEARQALSNLRVPGLENRTLPEALSAIGGKLTDGSPVAFHPMIKGRVRELGYAVQASLYLIAREAITNAVNHAGARHVVAQLTYADKEVRLVVQDDGNGFDPAVATAKKDHWGLAGMRERAQQIGATFMVDTEPGRGTSICVSVAPGR